MLISALNHGHGNLIAVTDNIEQLKAEKHRKSPLARMAVPI